MKGPNALIVFRTKGNLPAIVSVRQYTDFLTLEFLAGNLTAGQYAGALRAVAKLAADAHKALLSLLGELQDKVAKTRKECDALRNQQPPLPPAATGSFHLLPNLTQVTNPNAPELKIDAAGQKALWDHCCDAGAWKVDFKFDVPGTLTPGKASPLTLGIDVHDVKPEQPLQVGMSAFAPDFKEQLLINYPNPSEASKTYQLTISPSLKDAEEIVVTIGVVSAEVKYHYRRG